MSPSKTRTVIQNCKIRGCTFEGVAKFTYLGTVKRRCQNEYCKYWRIQLNVVYNSIINIAECSVRLQTITSLHSAVS